MVGANVRAYRLAAGLSGAQLALRARLSDSMLSRIEGGLVSPSLCTLTKVAAALGLPMSALLDQEVEFWAWWAARPTGWRQAAANTPTFGKTVASRARPT